MDIMEPKYEGF